MQNKTTVYDNQGRVANLDINNAQIIVSLKIANLMKVRSFAGRYS